VVAVVASVGAGLSVGLLAGWAVVAATNVVWLLSVVWPMDAEQTRSHTTSVDPGRPVARLITRGQRRKPRRRGRGADREWEQRPRPRVPRRGVAIAAVVSSWALIQVDYMLRYARVYGRVAAGMAGGIDFNQDDAPTYSDFGYFSVGLGMTYQVSDTNVRE
jgi:hypothetical protein